MDWAVAPRRAFRRDLPTPREPRPPDSTAPDRRVPRGAHRAAGEGQFPCIVITEPPDSTSSCARTRSGSRTSNFGSALPKGPGLGFVGSPPRVPETVEQAVATAFRPEPLNRIDRLVVFRPLPRDVLREILHKELHDVFRRRGLHNREWVVIRDETAIDFLLDRGTTPQW